MRKVIYIGLADVLAVALLFSACGKESDDKPVEIGGLTWMGKNLNDPSKGGKCHEDEPKNCKKDGRLYTWKEAMKACPKGWHLPNNAEYEAIMAELAGSGRKDGNSWWSATKYNKIEGDTSIAYTWSTSGSSYWNIHYKYPVRCVKDCAGGVCKKDNEQPEAELDPDEIARIALFWPARRVDEFGCMMEKNFGHRDERFNCSLTGYKNKGSPCRNTDEYKEGFNFPEHLVNKVHPQLSKINLNWEGGRLQMMTLSFDNSFTEAQVLSVFGLTQDIRTRPKNIIEARAHGSSLYLTGFEHIGAEDVDCEEEHARPRSVEIDGLAWMAKNLNDASKGGKCYEDEPKNCDKYGRLYTWAEAIRACQEGWYLPSKAEWEALTKFAGGEDVAGGKLKAKKGWEYNNGTDEYGFSALPGGSESGDSESGVWSSTGSFGYWWGSSESSSLQEAYYWTLCSDDASARWDYVEKSILRSVRCVKPEKHKSVKIGNQKWMVQNLNDPSKGGKCYEDKQESCEKYGRLYTWEEALKACPEGWHLPSGDEWAALVSFAGGREVAGSKFDEIAGAKLKSKNGWNNYESKSGNGTNEYGFSALPGGSGDSDGSFSGVGNDGYWWSDTEIDFITAHSRGMYHSGDIVSRQHLVKRDLLSVRCIKD